MKSKIQDLKEKKDIKYRLLKILKLEGGVVGW